MRTSKETIEYIMKLAKEQDITQRELAAKVNLTETSISRYVNGKRDFPIAEVPLFAAALGTTVEDILGIHVTVEGKYPNFSKIINFAEDLGILTEDTVTSPAFQEKILQAIVEDLLLLIRSKNSQSS